MSEAPPLCLAPLPPGAPPARRLPKGACDTHIHVFGPAGRYPLMEVRAYTPPVLTLDDYRPVMAHLGIERAVLIQPSVYGTDNRLHLEALQAAPDMLRAVVVISPETSDDELHRLDGLGVRGIRINRYNPGGLSLDDVFTLGARIAPLGWHIQLQIALSNTLALARLVRTCPAPLVVDHFGLPDPAKGVAAPCFQDLLRLLGDGHVWVKLSAPYRSSRRALPYPDLAPFAEALIACRPDRLLWATDWPHVDQFTVMPDDAALLDASPVWQTTPGIQQAILVDNPGQLYWYE
jgi:predicted TIM-barrel fold metal-dependent hydrolase